MKVIITGSTGMVGKSVLMQSLDSKEVTQVLLINRRSLDMSHPKLRELIVPDLMDLSAIEGQLAGYEACFHCMGVSVVGMDEQGYTRLTYELTKNLAETLFRLNPEMVFNYVSGTGSDSSEQGRVMWARVKGKTENMILNMGFKDAYAFRLGALIPDKGIQSRTGWIKILTVLMMPFFPLMKRMKSITTSEKMGKAMINAVRYPQAQKHLENAQINDLAQMV